MKIKRPSKWDMYCPYCREHLIIEKGDIYVKTLPCREVEGLNPLWKLLFGRNQESDVECVTCVSCNKQIQLREVGDEWYNHPFGIMEYEVIDGANG